MYGLSSCFVPPIIFLTLAFPTMKTRKHPFQRFGRSLKHSARFRNVCCDMHSDMLGSSPLIPDWFDSLEKSICPTNSRMLTISYFENVNPHSRAMGLDSCQVSSCLFYYCFSSVSPSLSLHLIKLSRQHVSRYSFFLPFPASSLSFIYCISITMSRL